MIHATDLRIGNLVTVDNLVVSIEDLVNDVEKGYAVRVVYTRKEQNDTVSFVRRITDLQPIPLSPEVLGKCGFTYFASEGISSFGSDFNPDENTHCWSKSIKPTNRIDGHEISLVKWGEQEYFTFQLGRGTYRQEIKYLHTLINLWYFLSGTELNYQP